METFNENICIFNYKRCPAKSFLSRCSLAYGFYLFTAEIPTVCCQTKYLLQSVILNRKEKKLSMPKYLWGLIGNAVSWSIQQQQNEFSNGIRWMSYIIWKMRHLKNNYGAQCLVIHHFSNKTYERTFILLLKIVQADFVCIHNYYHILQ